MLTYVHESTNYIATPEITLKLITGQTSILKLGVASYSWLTLLLKVENQEKGCKT